VGGCQVEGLETRGGIVGRRQSLGAEASVSILDSWTRRQNVAPGGLIGGNEEGGVDILSGKCIGFPASLGGRFLASVR
jgi:hypothetical protein